MSLQAAGGGKGGAGGSGVEGYWYYGSFAAVVCIGPVDELVALSIDKKEVWRPASPIKRSEVSNPYTFTVGVRGDVHFYWGTDDQVLTDPVLSPRYRLHPAYRHRAVIVFDDFVLGQERENVPEIEVLMRRKPNQSFITGDAAELDADGQANAIAFLVELWNSSIIGLGRSTDMLDLTTWQAVADALDADNLRYYLSPVLTKARSFDDLFDELRGYLPLWSRINNSGKIELGLFEVADPTTGGLPSIDKDDLMGSPTIEAHSLDETDARLDLRYLDRDHGFSEERVRFDSVQARFAQNTDRVAEVEREWITRNDQAQDHVAREGLRESRPWDELKLSVMIGRAASLTPGALFNFSYSPLDYSALCRVVERKGDGDDPTAVTIEAETVREPSASLLTPLADPNPAQGEKQNPPLSHWRVLQAPSALAGGPFRVMTLAGRDSLDQNRLRTWMSYAGAEYVQLKLPFGEARGAAVPRWAVPVQLADDYADTEALDDETGNLKVSLFDSLPTGDFDALDGDQSADEIADDNLLLIIVDPADDTSFEVLTIKSIESPTSGEYPLHVLRARFGTERLSFSASDPAWIIERDRLEFFRHTSLETAAGSSAPDNVVDFKVQPGVGFFTELALSEITAQELTLEPQLAATVIIDGNADL